MMKATIFKGKEENSTTALLFTVIAKSVKKTPSLHTLFFFRNV